MNIKFLAFTFTAIFIFSACEDITSSDATIISAKTTLDEDKLALEKAFAEIQNLASSKTCTDGTMWKTTAYGNKACGGPSGYVAYHKEVNEALLLEKIAAFTNAQKQYNTKHKIVSDCMLAQEPSGVDCKDGKAVLKY